MAGDWRLFIAVDLGDEARALLRAAQGTGRAAGLPCRWVDPAGAHLTLKFLGDTDPAHVGALGRALRGVAARHAPFAVRCGGLGGFPSLRRPRVLWLGVADRDGRLGALQRDIEAALVGLAPPPEPQPFRPHLTLGRLREGGAVDPTALAAARATIDPLVASLPVAALSLFRSELGPRGARYTRLLELPLGTTAAPATARELPDPPDVT